MTGYEAARTLPPALLRAAIRIEEQRQYEARLDAVTDASIAAGLKLGMRYVDPKAKGRNPDEPYHSLDEFHQHRAFLEAHARPWTVRVETPEEREERLDREQDEAFRRAFGVMQA